MPTGNPFFDKKQVVEKRTGGDLPHWEQQGKMQYVTFRLADSLPQVVIQHIREMEEQFMRDHPRPWSTETAAQFKKLKSPAMEEFLDNGYGSCVLKSAEIRALLVSAINYYDGKAFETVAYVIMPNHVHLLVIMFSGVDVRDVMHSIKSYTSHKINKLLGYTGKLWQRESFDRIVRSSAQMRNYITYIENNPRNLPPDSYTLYLSPKYR